MKIFFNPIIVSLLRIIGRRLTDHSDEELLKLYRQERKQKVLAELFTRYTHLVYGVCMKYLTNTDDASDAVMAIYEKLAESLHQYDVKKFSVWLHVLTKNHCLMVLRNRKAIDKKHEIWLGEQDIFMESTPFLHPLDEEYDPIPDQLKKCLEALKPEQKRCIEWFYYHDKCYLEIASLMNVDEKAVKSHLQNGKRNLKICLEKDDGKESK